jgi:RNA-directed DNA polymerase
MRPGHSGLLHDLAASRRCTHLKGHGGAKHGQYLRRTSERGGSFWDYEKGISLGCPLSPLIGAFFLHRLDVAMERLGLFYVRFMDDVLVLARSRWQLRRAVKVVNQALAALSLEKHPDKTFVGRIERGFDFLGYHFSRVGLTVAAKTIANFIEKASRLYEQKRKVDCYREWSID